MQNLFETDSWKSTKARYNAYWNGEKLDKCVFHLTSLSDQSKFSDKAAEKWMDIDRRKNEHLTMVRNMRYFADAFPHFFTDMGPGNLAAVIGGDFVPADNTVWFDRSPILADTDDLSGIYFREDGLMWQHTKSLMDAMMKTREVNVSVTDIGGTLDVLASLRGTQRLLYDLIDDPDWVKEAISVIAPLWKRMFDESMEMLLAGQDGMSSWMPIWSDVPYFPLQCDFCAMLSPAMFREFVLPDLIHQTEIMPRSIYHLDGPDEVAHLDMLLEIPTLDMIQWVPGAGAPSPADPCWFPMYDKILASGKGMVFLWASAEEAEVLLKRHGHDRIYIHTDCYDDRKAEHLAEIHAGL